MRFIRVFILYFFVTSIFAMEKTDEHIDLLHGIVFGSLSECKICEEEYIESSLLSLLPCGHFYCLNCFSKQKNICAYCKRDFAETDIFFLEIKDLTSQSSPHLLSWQTKNGDEKDTLRLLLGLKKLRDEKILSQEQFLTILNVVDSDGNTPLHMAALKNWISVVTFLLEAKADLLASDHKSDSPYDVARKKKHIAIMKLLRPHLPKGLYPKKSDLVLAFQLERPASFHWFPWLETKKGGDHINNVYAPFGPLYKYDLFAQSQSQAYEKKHCRLKIGSKKPDGGHNAEAAAAACLLKEPSRDVLTYADSKPISFTPNDIAGLLVKVMPHLVVKKDFNGRNMEFYDGKETNDLRPEEFLVILESWTKEYKPFVIDFSCDGAILSIACYKVMVSESSELVDGGVLKTYCISIWGEFEKPQILRCYVQKNHEGQVTLSGWLKKNPGIHHPHFIWRAEPRGDLTDKKTWQECSRVTNPHVDPQIVYEIYRLSL